MNEDLIERYETFNTTGCPYELLFGDFHYQLIPPDYYDFLNGDNDNDDNIHFTPVENILPEKEGVKYAVMKNDEYIDDAIIIDDSDSLTSDIDPSKTKLWKLKEWMQKMKEWTQKMKDWKMTME